MVWYQGAAPAASWREFLLGGLVDDPGKLVQGWSTVLAGDQELAALSAAVTGQVRSPGGGACPERGYGVSTVIFLRQRWSVRTCAG